MKLYEALAYGETKLSQADIPNAKIDARFLIEFVLNKNRTFFLAHSKEEMDEEAWLRYQQALNKRIEHIPLQYITFCQNFMGLDFYVNPDVLIPRMDTECLVEEAEKLLKRGNIFPSIQQGKRVLDMCTGSGCIIISLKKRNEDITAFGADISKKALQVAKKNSETYRTEISFLESDLFFDFNESHFHKPFDMIISNPPYIATEDIQSLMEEVKGYEPLLALDGSSDGLHFYREIARDGYAYLNAGGHLLFEIGCEQAEEVSQIMNEAGFHNISVVKDLAGLNRVVIGGKGDV